MYLYMMSPIDYFAGCLTKEELINNLTKQVWKSFKDIALTLNQISEFEQKALDLAKSSGGWDGDFSQEVLYFSIPDLEAIEMRIGIVWKQVKRGSTFVATLEPLDYLQKYRIA